MVIPILVILTVLSPALYGMEIVKKDPRNIEHILHDNAAWLMQLQDNENSGRYCEDLCIARRKCKEVLQSADSTMIKFGNKALGELRRVVREERESREILDCFKRSVKTGKDVFVDEQCDLINKLPFFKTYCNIHFPDMNGITLVHYAAAHDALNSILKRIVTEDYALDKDGRSPWFYVIEHNALRNFITLKQYYFSSLDTPDYHGVTLAHCAARSINAQYYFEEIYYGLDANARDAMGDTSLHILLRRAADNDTVECLLGLSNTDLSARNNAGESYLEVAAKADDDENSALVVRVLNKKIFKFISLHNDGVEHSCNPCEMVAECIQAGANINAPLVAKQWAGYNEHMALPFVIAKGCVPCLRLLIENNVEVTPEVIKKAEALVCSDKELIIELLNNAYKK